MARESGDGATRRKIRQATSDETTREVIEDCRSHMLRVKATADYLVRLFGSALVDENVLTSREMRDALEQFRIAKNAESNAREWYAAGGWFDD